MPAYALRIVLCVLCCESRVKFHLLVDGDVIVQTDVCGSQQVIVDLLLIRRSSSINNEFGGCLRCFRPVATMRSDSWLASMTTSVRRWRAPRTKQQRCELMRDAQCRCRAAGTRTLALTASLLVAPRAAAPIKRRAPHATRRVARRCRCARIASRRQHASHRRQCCRRFASLRCIR
jgi:hypothetical protein